MNLAEIEATMVSEGFSEELFLQFLEKLKRVRGSYNKCQHCYTTAFDLKRKDSDSAIRMIRYGLDNFATGWMDFYRSYENLAMIHIRKNSFEDARACYLAQLEKMVEFEEERYANVLAVNLVFAELHCGGFTCTDDLRKFHGLAKSDLAKNAFTRRERFYFALAELVMAVHDRGSEGAQSAYWAVMRILHGLDPNSNDTVFAKHHYRNDAYATEESLRYLESIGSLWDTH